MAGMWARGPPAMQGWRSDEAMEEARRLQRQMEQNRQEDRRRAEGGGGTQWQAPSVTAGWDAPAVPVDQYTLGGGGVDGVTKEGGRKRGRDGSDSDWGAGGGGGDHGGVNMASVGWQAPSFPAGWQPPSMPVDWPPLALPVHSPDSLNPKPCTPDPNPAGLTRF